MFYGAFVYNMRIMTIKDGVKSTVNLATAKAQLSELIYRAESGEEILVTRHGQPVVRISAVEQPKLPVSRGIKR